jgi:hypothetical protein
VFDALSTPSRSRERWRSFEAQVVGADGQVRTASADQNPDLFWAIRGGVGSSII